MSESLTIVVKGSDGVRRSQMTEIIKQALTEKGFTDVNILGVSSQESNGDSRPFRETPILIVES